MHGLEGLGCECRAMPTQARCQGMPGTGDGVCKRLGGSGLGVFCLRTARARCVRWDTSAGGVTCPPGHGAPAPAAIPARAAAPGFDLSLRFHPEGFLNLFALESAAKVPSGVFLNLFGLETATKVASGGVCEPIGAGSAQSLPRRGVRPLRVPPLRVPRDARAAAPPRDARAAGRLGCRCNRGP